MAFQPSEQGTPILQCSTNHVSYTVRRRKRLDGYADSKDKQVMNDIQTHAVILWPLLPSLYQLHVHVISFILVYNALSFLFLLKLDTFTFLYATRF
jgi:hypothetical protein